ncbi:Cys-Gln thioester bond-forming surface protein [Streptomyces sp. x-80]|uniref:Cys-Gln thioester bond-forming surface protein n=1 Tax=Streptomyces sp. x-80 TaxID=2789282 RepID=UPI00397EDCED
MFCERRRGTARLYAAVTAAALAASALVMSTPAAADPQDDPAGAHGATATLGGLSVSGRVTLHDGHGTREMAAGLFDLAVDGGGTLRTYCIDIFNPTQPRATYQETPWKESSLHDNPDAGKIRWILQNSYPQVTDLGRLGSAAGVGTLTKEQAAAGTQAAIWRFSDHVDARAKDPVAEKLAGYLQRSARTVEEPRPSLALTAEDLAGKSGERLGPLTVATSADKVAVAVDAEAQSRKVSVVDSAGKPVTTAVNGSRLYVDVPAGTAAGSATVKAEATTSVPVGRVFTGVGHNKGSQTMILAGSSAGAVTAEAVATWAKAGEKTAVPSVGARKNCAKGGVDITAANKGDADYTFTVAGKEHTVRAGGSSTVTVPVAEDTAYDIKVALPGGVTKEFKGLLDCETAGKKDAGTAATPAASPGAGATGDSGAGEGDLAATGSSAATPVMAGVAAVLLLAGGGAVLFTRRRKSAGGSGR